MIRPRRRSLLPTLLLGPALVVGAPSPSAGRSPAAACADRDVSATASSPRTSGLPSGPRIPRAQLDGECRGVGVSIEEEDRWRPHLVGAAAPAPSLALQPQAARGDCTTKCHQDLKKGAFLHGPVQQGKCTSCHKQPDPDEHEFTPIADAVENCRSCHEAKDHAVVHAAYADNDCTDCHDPHKGSSRSLLRAAEEVALCSMCHKPQAAALRKPVVHGPVASENCTLCHSAHSAPKPKLLRMDSADLCRSCHKDSAAHFAAAAHLHAPVKDNCTGCHDPHGSEHGHLLKLAPRELCLSCHTELAESLTHAKVGHGALTQDKECGNCHLPHASTVPRLLERPVKDLCLSCHDDEIHRADDTRVRAIGAEISAAKYLHGPVREGECTDCHLPHAAHVTDLLVKPYPAAFYAPYQPASYELCYGCHDRKAFESEKAGTLTGFRDGNRNLHHLHVSKADKGRTCRACHEVHGSNVPKHMREHVPFGAWQMPLRFEPLPSGGSCAPGCHKAVTYDRGAQATPAPRN